MFPSLSTINTAALIRTNYRIWYYSVVRNMERRREHILISHKSAEEREVVGGGSLLLEGAKVKTWSHGRTPACSDPLTLPPSACIMTWEPPHAGVNQLPYNKTYIY